MTNENQFTQIIKDRKRINCLVMITLIVNCEEYRLLISGVLEVLFN